MDRPQRNAGFGPRMTHDRGGRRLAVIVTDLIATLALVVSTLAVAAVLTIGAAHAAGTGQPVHSGSLTHVIETLAGGLGGYAALRALQRD
jgi:hypothetical protein